MNLYMAEDCLRDELKEYTNCLRGWLNNDDILDDTPREQLLDDTIKYMLGAASFALRLGLDEETVDAIYAEYRKEAQKLYDNWG